MHDKLDIIWDNKKSNLRGNESIDRLSNNASPLGSVTSLSPVKQKDAKGGRPEQLN